ncbi:hypothetical protein B0T25DRAFT_6335 [Lasiosphaeria hispida]|uniref:Uncharacterized protein n=1 Tax=Lasiosphaeria hispida TaxID=260671 RepID=A0AAJ0HTQ3_9PEZI|nr:hypothetical protein B0T25DRAFT_6335 [Lasiosphaeria hispida]
MLGDMRATRQARKGWAAHLQGTARHVHGHQSFREGRAVRRNGSSLELPLALSSQLVGNSLRLASSRVIANLADPFLMQAASHGLGMLSHLPRHMSRRACCWKLPQKWGMCLAMRLLHTKKHKHEQVSEDKVRFDPQPAYPLARLLLFVLLCSFALGLPFPPHMVTT